MHDYFQIKTQLQNFQYSKACEWIENKIRLYKNKFARQMVVCNAFGILFSVILAFFTWVVLYPSADEKELAAFPLATLCNDLFNTLCETVPGGKTAVIIGLIVIPFLTSIVLAVISLFFKPKKYVATDNDDKRTARDMKERIEFLKKLHDKYEHGWPTVLFLYFVLTVVLTGIIITFGSIPGGLNPFEYVFVGAICAAVQAIPFFASAWIFSLFYKDKAEWTRYIYDWYNVLDRYIVTPKKERFISSSSRMQETEYYKEKFGEYYDTYMGRPHEEKKVDTSFLDDHDYSHIFEDKNF